MHETTLRMRRVEACPCGMHALVALVDDDDRLRARLRVGIEAGRSLSAFAAGLPDALSATVLSIQQCMRAVGARPVAILLSNADGRVEVSMCLTAPDGEHVQTVIDPGVALLAAHVLELPIGLQPSGTSSESAPAAPVSAAVPIPEVYRGLLEHLRWDDLP